MTLVRIHAYVLRIGVGDVKDRYRHDIPNIVELQLIFNTIQSLGKECVIVTFGQPEVSLN